MANYFIPPNYGWKFARSIITNSQGKRREILVLLRVRFLERVHLV